MRRTREEAEVTRRNLLEAALEVFSQKGYAATRVEDIARRAEVTTGAIYHHFSGKSELYTTLIEASDAKTNQLAQRIVEEGGSSASILRRMVVNLFQFLEEDKEYQAVAGLFLNQTRTSPELAPLAQQALEGRRASAQFFASMIRAGIDEGDFRPDLSPEDAALALLGFMHGLSLIWVQDPEYFSIKERAEKLVDMFLAGIVVS